MGFPVAAAIMVAGTLFTYPDNFRAQKALIAAKYSGAQLTVAKDFVFGETNKTPDFLKKFPLGKVPAFEGSDGVILTESNAIAYYVANEELRGGSDAAARAQVVQWMCMADNEILPASCTWVFPTMGIMQFNKNATERAKEDIKAALQTLNDHLLTRTFWTQASGSHSLMSPVGSPQLSTSPMLNLSLGPSLSVPKWPSLIPRSLPNFQERELETRLRHLRPRQRRKRNQRRRKKRRKILKMMVSEPWSQRRKTLLMPCPRDLSILRNGRDFTQTMTKNLQLPGSGTTLTTRTTPSGRETINTMTSSLWSSCLATLSVECSSVWRSLRRMLLLLLACLARITTPLSVVSGSLRGRSWLLSSVRIGRSTMPAMNGRSLTPSPKSARRRWLSTGSGRVRMPQEDPSTRARFSSRSAPLSSPLAWLGLLSFINPSAFLL